MVGRHSAIYELKDTAKWSNDRVEKKAAIQQLSTYGEDAISALDEIFMVAVSDEIRVACVDAIKSITEKTTQKQEIVNSKMAESPTTA